RIGRRRRKGPQAGRRCRPAAGNGPARRQVQGRPGGLPRRRIHRRILRRMRMGLPFRKSRVTSANGATAPAPSASPQHELTVDLERRRDQLVARVAELQWDLGGLVYEMAVRNRIDVEVLVKRAVALQDADAELSEVERIVRMEQTGTAGSC